MKYPEALPGTQCKDFDNASPMSDEASRAPPLDHSKAPVDPRDVYLAARRRKMSKRVPGFQEMQDTMDDPSACLPADGLAILLSKLPMELRLKIYLLSLPLLRHHKRKANLTYLKELSWTGSSTALFAQVGPLVLRERALTFHTSLREGSNLIDEFDDTIDHTFSGQAPWAIEQAHQMINVLNITIRFTRLYISRNDLAQRIQQYLKDTSVLTNVKQVNFSLSPECLPSSPEDFIIVHQQGEFRGQRRIPEVEVSSNHFSFLHGLKEDVADVYASLPSVDCQVQWTLDRSGLPNIPKMYQNRSDVIVYLENMNKYANGLFAAQTAPRL